MEPKEFGKIGVLGGGPSNEREISLQSGKAVYNALKGIGADVIFLDIKRGLDKEETKGLGIDIAFIALHGRFGEDGIIQGILEEADIPYTGSGPLASRLSLDKIASREIFIKNGIDAPRFRVVEKNNFCDFEELLRFSGFPLVVKPQFEGSSIGISIVKNARELEKGMELAFSYSDKILVEEYIKGRELTVGILDNEPLPVVEIVAREGFYDFKAKYRRDDTEYIVPARIDQRDYERSQRLGRQAHALLGCASFSRVDMLLDEGQDRIFVLEVNSIPGLTNHSLLPKAAAYAGIGFSQLCLKILESALCKKSKTPASQGH